MTTEEICLQPEGAGQERGAQFRNLLKLMGEPGPQADEDGSSLKATQMRSIVNSHRLAGAYKEKARVAYVSEQFPSEIVFAFNVIPWNIESMAIMLAQSVDVDRVIQVTQEQELSRDICSFLRGPRGMMWTDCYPTPDLILMNNQPCEGLSKLGVLAGKGYQAPWLALHTPSTVDEDSLGYLVKQMERMMSQMEEVLGIKLGPEALLSTVRYSNQAREYYSKTVELLKTHRLPGVARELQEIFGMNYFGVKENVQICKMLYEEASELVGVETDRKKRVMWLGQMPEESHELLRHMRQVVDIVFWSPLWDGNAVTLDEDEPLRGIAERAILYHWDTERMRTETAQMCDDYEIEGFLIANVWGCRNMMGVSPMLRELATSKNLKYLTINIDLVDRNNYAFNHVKNRIDAFLEIIQ